MTARQQTSSDDDHGLQRHVKRVSGHRTSPIDPGARVLAPKGTGMSVVMPEARSPARCGVRGFRGQRAQPAHAKPEWSAQVVKHGVIMSWRRPRGLKLGASCR